MRLPNGYGGVCYLGRGRRRPWLARKTIGYKENGTPVYHNVGYYTSREDAIVALGTINQSEPCVVTSLSTLYNQWIQLQEGRIKKATLRGYWTSYKHLAPIAGIPLDKLCYQDMQDIVSQMRKEGLSYSSVKKVRSLLSLLIRYATINDIEIKPYHKYLELGHHIPVKPHKPFTRQQINKLWNLPDADIPLFMLYTGLRSIEVINLKLKDINWKGKYFTVRVSKTASGLRVVPIHSRLLSIVQQKMKDSHTYLFEHNRKPYTYTRLRQEFQTHMQAINAKHTTHDCRHTFATLLDTAGANPVTRRHLLGHKHGDVTDRVYTHKALRELRKTIELLK